MLANWSNNRAGKVVFELKLKKLKNFYSSKMTNFSNQSNSNVKN